MARKETILRNNKQEKSINLDAPVGPVKVARTRNLHGDVMLVQGVLFTFAKRISLPFVGLSSVDQVPTPNGVYDAKTENAIARYQAARSNELMVADGVVDPGNYRHRNVIECRDCDTSTPLMTITNFHVNLRVLFEPDTYIDELIRLVPQLRPILK